MNGFPQTTYYQCPPGLSPQATWTPVGCNITVATLCTPVCGQAAGMAQGGQGTSPQATLTPIGCPPPTLPMLCPLTLPPICGPQGASPQATLTPVGCNITVFSLCTPVCGQAAGMAQGGGQAAAPQTFLPTIGPVCFTFAFPCGPGGGQGASPQATFTPVGCNITVATLCTPVCGQAAGMAQGASPQATWTPVNCNTLFSICTPFCAQAAGMAQAGGQGGVAQTLVTIGWCAQGASPQATFTPVGCNITVFSLCTPVCGQTAGAGQAGPLPPIHTILGCPVTVACPPPPHTLLGCPVTIACPPHTVVGCPGPTAIVACQSALVCPTLACGAGGGPYAASPQATFTPVGCNITVFSLCTPVCG